jgi:hypothetical protein
MASKLTGEFSLHFVTAFLSTLHTVYLPSGPNCSIHRLEDSICVQPSIQPRKKNRSRLVNGVNVIKNFNSSIDDCDGRSDSIVSEKPSIRTAHLR